MYSGGAVAALQGFAEDTMYLSVGQGNQILVRYTEENATYTFYNRLSVEDRVPPNVCAIR